MPVLLRVTRIFNSGNSADNLKDVLFLILQHLDAVT